MNKAAVFLSDMKRALSEPAFFKSVILGILILFVPLVYFLITGNYNNADMLFKKSQAAVYPFCAALLCAFPYSGMQMLEDYTGYKTLMKLKMRRAGYSLPRFFVCGITGAAALFIPQALLLITVLFTDGCLSDWKEITSGIIMSVPFGFSYSVLAYSLTFYNRKRYIPIVFPQVLFMLCTYAFPHLKLNDFYPPLAISPWLYGDAPVRNMLVIPGVILFAAAVLSAAGSAYTKRK